MVVDVKVLHLGLSPIRHVAKSDFQILHDGSVLYDYEYFVESSERGLPGIDLIAGGSTSDCVAFEVLIHGQLEHIYAPCKYDGQVPGRYLIYLVRP